METAKHEEPGPEMVQVQIKLNIGKHTIILSAREARDLRDKLNELAGGPPVICPSTPVPVYPTPVLPAYPGVGEPF